MLRRTQDQWCDAIFPIVMKNVKRGGSWPSGQTPLPRPAQACSQLQHPNAIFLPCAAGEGDRPQGGGGGKPPARSPVTPPPPASPVPLPHQNGGGKGRQFLPAGEGRSARGAEAEGGLRFAERGDGAITYSDGLNRKLLVHRNGTTPETEPTLRSPRLED